MPDVHVDKYDQGMCKIRDGKWSLMIKGGERTIQKFTKGMFLRFIRPFSASVVPFLLFESSFYSIFISVSVFYLHIIFVSLRLFLLPNY